MRRLTTIGDASSLDVSRIGNAAAGGSPLSKSRQSRAVQAFWAMHVEALNWSGQTATHYAAALNISAISLRRWRDLFDADTVAIDWCEFVRVRFRK